MFPMALLTAIVRKEALLPEHTAAFAATQLLPVIQAATARHLAATPDQQRSPELCKEFLVSAIVSPLVLCRQGLVVFATCSWSTWPAGSCCMWVTWHARSTGVLSVVDNVLIPGDQLSVGCAAWTSGGAQDGSRHGV